MSHKLQSVGVFVIPAKAGILNLLQDLCVRRDDREEKHVA